MKRVVLLFLAPVLWAQGLSPTQIRDVEALITAEMSREHIPGMSVAVATKDGSIWSNGYGMSDLENFVPAKASTEYRTASIAKPMTAVAAMQLVESGGLDLDVPIQRFVPKFPSKQWPVTMRQLLGHIGGIRDYRDGLERYITKHYSSLSDAIEVFAQDPLVHEPGTKYLYSTFGFVLAGYVVETVAKQPYMTILQHRIFEPASMKNTVADDVYTIVPNRSRGYQRQADGTVLNAALADTSHKIPGGGLLSTATDIVRFARAVGEGKLLKKETVEQMWQPLRTADGRSTGYGLGWGIGALGTHRLVSHSGGQAGVSTMLRYLPDDRVAVALMCNLEGRKLDSLADSLLSIALQ